jgi:RhtB (resistance to homoserine/threonine) family protein
MFGINQYEAFLLASIALNLTPGNDTIYILSRSIAQGRIAGIMSVLGIATGSLIHTTFAAVGLSIIISKSILLFNIIKYVGAAYLVFIGLKMFFSKQPRLEINNISQKEEKFKVYYQAVLTNVSNPKVALFFISFLPQFINPVYENSYISFLLLGLTFTITGTTWCFVLANFASYISNGLRRNKFLAVILNKVCGATLIGLGIKLAFSKNS